MQLNKQLVNETNRLYSELSNELADVVDFLDNAHAEEALSDNELYRSIEEAKRLLTVVQSLRILKIWGENETQINQSNYPNFFG